MRKKIVLALLVVAFSGCLLSGFALRNDWTINQNKAHQIAEIAREMGLPETDPIIIRAKSIWYSEEAQKLASKAEAQIQEEINVPEDLESIEPAPVEPEIYNDEDLNEPVKEEPADAPAVDPEMFMQSMQEELQEILEVAATSKYTKGIENYTQQDIDFLASVIYNEAGYGTSRRQKELTGACVVNRVNCPWLGSSIEEVIKWPGQYLPAYAQYGSYYMNRAMESDIWSECCEIAEQCLKGEVNIPYDVIFQAEFTQGRATYEIQYTDYSVTYFCYSLYEFDNPMQSEAVA